jgi:hypothetical protein
MLDRNKIVCSASVLLFGTHISPMRAKNFVLLHYCYHFMLKKCVSQAGKFL